MNQPAVEPVATLSVPAPAPADRDLIPFPLGDSDLLHAIRSGDITAYATLYERHAAAARVLAFQLVRGPAEVDDVVAEAFTKVLDLLQRGGGPEDAFRPYLLTAVRRLAYDRYRVERRVVSTDSLEDFDPGQPFEDPAVAGLEQSMIARAFRSLPDRWRAVLWHTEIESARPAEVAAVLGLSPNSVAALAYRAREALRQAYLQMHLSGDVRPECRPVAGKLGGYVRGGLAVRDSEKVAAHLEDCGDCWAVYTELSDVNGALRGVVALVFLGPLAGGYLSGAASAASSAAVKLGLFGWLRRAPKHHQAAVAGGGAAAAAAAVAVTAVALAAASPAPTADRLHQAAASHQSVSHHPAPVTPGQRPAASHPAPATHPQAQASPSSTHGPVSALAQPVAPGAVAARPAVGVTSTSAQGDRPAAASPVRSRPVTSPAVTSPPSAAPAGSPAPKPPLISVGLMVRGRTSLQLNAQVPPQK